MQNQIKIKGFDALNDQQYDKSILSQRVYYIIDVMNPIRFFTAPFQLKNAQIKVKQFEANASKSGAQFTSQEVKQYRQQKKIVQSIIHPDTNKPIPWYGRMSGFVPLNIPISFIMLMARPTVLNIIGGQWINQTYNAGMNYSNRNATSQYSNIDVLKAYLSAVLISGSISYLGQEVIFKPWVDRFKTRGTQRIARSIFCFIAVAASGISNLILMRKKQLNDGIHVYDQESGEQIGKSKLAAKRAVLMTAFTRPFMCVTMFIPVGVMYALQVSKRLPKSRAGNIAIQMTLCGIGLYIGLIMSISCFPQTGRISAEKLEPQYRNFQINGRVVKSYTYNKGL